MPHQMLEQAGQRREAAAHRRGGGPLLFADDPLPGDDGAMINLAQQVWGGNVKGAHEVRHVELVGAAVRALFWLASQTSSSGIAAKLASWPGRWTRMGRERVSLIKPKLSSGKTGDVREESFR